MISSCGHFQKWAAVSTFREWTGALLLTYEVESKSNLNCLIKREQWELERCLFLNFSQGSHHQFKCTCAAVIAQPKGSCKLVFSNGMHNPYPACLEAVLGQQETSQLFLHSRKEEKGHWGNILWIGWVGDHLDTFCHQGLLGRDFGTDRVILR